MRSSEVAGGDNALATQYNNVRDDAKGGAALLAHEQSTPDATLYVEPGVIYFNGLQVIFAGGNSPSFSAPSANPRIDLLVMNSSGVLSIVQGSEAASPTAPTYPEDKIPICEVYNRVGQTIIYDDDNAGQGYVYRDVRPFAMIQGNASSVRAYRNGVQAVAQDSATKVEFNAESYDKRGEFDSTTNYRFTCVLPGRYLIKTQIAWGGVESGEVFELRIYKNGSQYSLSFYVTPNTSIITQSHSDILDLAAGDYIEIYVRHDGTVSQDISSGEDRSFLVIQKIS